MIWSSCTRSICTAFVCFCGGLTSPAAVNDRFAKISPNCTGAYVLDTVCSCHILPKTCSAPSTSFSGNFLGRPSTVMSLYLEVCFCQT